MKLRAIIYTTSPTTWFHTDLDVVRKYLRNTKGLEIDTFDVEHVSIDDIPAEMDSDGDIKPAWYWFSTLFTSRSKGYNAVILHISREEKKRWGFTVNGTYRNDRDEVLECWFAADKGQRAQHYHFSEFVRLTIHELSHGFERWTMGQSVLVHEYDYELRQLQYVPRLFDFTEWNRLQAERDRHLSTLARLLTRLLDKLKRPMKPLSPIDPKYFDQISQGFDMVNKRYVSGVHNGVDFACPVGTPIVAPADGTVILTPQDNPSMGNAVYFTCIINGRRVWMRFLHLSRIVPIGHYKRGDNLGYSGNTGDSDGPHCHHDLWSVPIDTSLIQTPTGVRKYMIDPVTFWQEQGVIQ